MASVLHGSARTTPCLRAEFQVSKECTRSLAARYGLNPKTVDKWRKRTTTADAPMGPKSSKRTVLTPAEEAVVAAFRQKTLLPLDDVLGCLMDAFPNLSRSARNQRSHSMSDERADAPCRRHGESAPEGDADRRLDALRASDAGSQRAEQRQADQRAAGD